jgi:hypothetical protein
MSRRELLFRLEEHIESLEVLGFDVGTGEEVIDFLARLEMEVVEHLLESGLSLDERESVLNWVEERKGELQDGELPLSEARRRRDGRHHLKRRSRNR